MVGKRKDVDQPAAGPSPKRFARAVKKETPTLETAITPAPNGSKHVATKPATVKEESQNGHADIPSSTGPDPASGLDNQSEPTFYQPTFYPAEMSNARCQAYVDGKIPRPITTLNSTLQSTKSARDKIAVGDAVVHWYKRDLRTHDNRGLAAASALAASKKVPLVCVFLISPEDYQAHFTSRMRVDFEFRTFDILRKDLGAKDIPLHVVTVEKRKDVIPTLLDLCQEWGAKHIFCNMEYEVDELRRETKLIKAALEKGIAVDVLHDDVVVPPGILATGQGKQFSVYSPWFRAWCARINAHPSLLTESPAPSANPHSARQTFSKIFSAPLPEIPQNKSLPSTDRAKFAKYWPAGEHEALQRLDKFLAEGRVEKYKDARNFPAQENTAKLSVHFSAGTLSARTAVRRAQEKSGTKKIDAGGEGVKCWISEVAWRDFYKHVMAWWPFVCMYKPFKYEMSDLHWPFDQDLWKAWTTGTTGFPIVDAALRQMHEMGWMHNRCRMVVASFLAKDLMIDWRHGERWFMEHLIDGDFASNSGGWGFSASVGVDPQPYFRIFNPLLQSEKFDPDGTYIRKWIPELRDVKGKAVHDPYGRGAGPQVAKAGYPKPCVVHSQRRDMVLALYKGLAKPGAAGGAKGAEADEEVKGKDKAKGVVNKPATSGRAK